MTRPLEDKQLDLFPRTTSSLTDGLEALQRVGDADEVLPLDHSAGGVRKPSFLLHRWEVGGAVDQPEALLLIQQDDACGGRESGAFGVRAAYAYHVASILFFHVCHSVSPSTAPLVWPCLLPAMPASPPADFVTGFWSL